MVLQANISLNYLSIVIKISLPSVRHVLFYTITFSQQSIFHGTPPLELINTMLYYNMYTFITNDYSLTRDIMVLLLHTRHVIHDSIH